jgi:general secretion pathway protein G
MLATTPSLRPIRRSAFTLIEVLVVMAIIVILAGVATVGIMKYLDTAKENVDESRMRLIVQAYKAYHLRTGGDGWPNDPSELINPPDGTKADLEGGIDAIQNPWMQPYTVQIVETATGPQPYVTSVRPHGTFTYPKK